MAETWPSTLRREIMRGRRNTLTVLVLKRKKSFQMRATSNRSNIAFCVLLSDSVTDFILRRYVDLSDVLFSNLMALALSILFYGGLYSHYQPTPPSVSEQKFDQLTTRLDFLTVIPYNNTSILLSL